MNQSTVKHIFYEYFNGNKNFMTPKIIGYNQKKYNRGTLIFQRQKNYEETLFGVTVLLVIGNEVSRTKLSKAFGNENEAIAYIKSIQNEDVEAIEIYDTKTISGV